MPRALLTLSAIGFASLASLGFATRARAANEASVPASGGLEALRVTVDASAKKLTFVAGKSRGELAIDLDAAEIDAAKIDVASFAVGDAKRAVHVRVPSRTRADVAWEAIVAGRENAVLWSGVTGFASGEEGERAGEAIDVPSDAGGFVVLGEMREDLHICGQTRTLLTPRVLDPKSMTFRGATMQRLPEDQRDDAEVIVASARGSALEAPLARLLLATGASTAIGAPSAMTDGDLATAWSEGRPGDGHGEFVTMRAPADVPIARLAITPAPTTLPPHGAAPRTFYLVTDTRTIAVTLPEDAWMHPGAAYDVPLVEPIRASCVSLVLDKSYARPNEPHPAVTIAELTAYAELDHPGATLTEVARALTGGGARAEAAKGILERAGDAGLTAASAAYASLDAPGRALAIDAAIGAGTCEASAPLLLAAMGDSDAEVARKGREKIERCGKRAAPALVSALAGADMKARANAAALLASVSPREAIDPLAVALAQGDAPTRAAVRSALAKACDGASVEKLDALLADPTRPADARLDLLRAFLSRFKEIAAPADAVIAALSAGASFPTRYRLVEPIAVLARDGDAAATARLASLITSDPDVAVRARAAELAFGANGAKGAVTSAIDDPAPRVRAAALHALAGLSPPMPIEAIAARLASDEWTFVRAAAAESLVAFGPNAHVDDLLIAALHDRATAVRALAIYALDARNVRRAASAIRERLVDAHEDLETRIRAVRALAGICDRDSLDVLTGIARQGALPLATDEDITLSLEAAHALGALHPPDLASRLAPLSARDASAEARASAARALATAPSCR